MIVWHKAQIALYTYGRNETDSMNFTLRRFTVGSLIRDFVPSSSEAGLAELISKDKEAWKTRALVRNVREVEEERGKENLESGQGILFLEIKTRKPDERYESKKRGGLGGGGGFWSD